MFGLVSGSRLDSCLGVRVWVRGLFATGFVSGCSCLGSCVISVWVRAGFVSISCLIRVGFVSGCVFGFVSRFIVGSYSVLVYFFFSKHI